MIKVFDICQCFVYNTDVYVFVVFMCLIYVKIWFGQKYPQILMNGKGQGRGGLRDRMDGSLLLAVQLCYVRDVVIYETTRIKFMVR